MKLTHAEVLEILELVRGAQLEYFELEFDGTRIVVGQNAHEAQHTSLSSPASLPVAEVSAAQTVASPDASAGEAAQQDSATATQAGAPQARDVASAPSGTSADAGDEADRLVVPAPIVGVFYSAPEPGADPYVRSGDVVEAGDTLGLIEVMKVFNSVVADVDAEVIEILVGNEEFVEHGQALFVLRPVAER